MSITNRILWRYGETGVMAWQELFLEETIGVFHIGDAAKHARSR
jgi:hypothetical protein